MRESLEKCNPDLLSPYLDKELGEEEHSLVELHLKECQACKRKLEELMSLSGEFEGLIKNQSLPSTDHRVEDLVLKRIRRYEVALWKRLKDNLSWKRVMVPASGISVAVLFLLFSWQPGNRGPTAIVKSISGDVSSIYILETPGTRQTILWFKERSEGKTS